MFVNNLMGKTTPGLINLIKRYWKITPKKRGLLFGFVSTGVFVIALRLLEPWPLKFVFDKIVAFSTHDNSGDLNTSHFLIIAALMVILIAGLRIITTVVHSHLMQSITNRLCQTLRNRIFSHIQILPIVQHENTVQKFSNLNNDIKQVQESLSQFAVPFAMNLLTLGSMLIVLLIINWQLTVFSIITVPAIWLIGVKTAQLLYRIKLNKNQRAKPALLGPPLYDDDMIDKIPTLTQEQPFNESYIETSSERIKKFLKSLKSSLGVEATSDILITVATALVLWYGAIQILNKTLTAGELLIFFAYLHFAFKPLRKFKLFQQKLHITNKVSQKIFDTLESDKLIQDLPNAIPLFSFQGALRFENVTVSNEYGENVVNNFNFYVQPDQVVALVAPTGSNKIAFIGLLLRLINSHQGRVLIDGYDIRSYSVECVQSQISLVLPENILFNASVRENIAFDINDATPADIEIAARIVNAHEFITKLPQGYDTKLSDDWNGLSKIQRLKIVLARTVLQNNPIIILDDPISKLNPDEQKEMTRILQKISKNRSTFFITHDARQSVSADLILYIENSCIKELGTHEELLDSAGPYSKLFDIQSNISNAVPAWEDRVAQRA